MTEVTVVAAILLGEILFVLFVNKCSISLLCIALGRANGEFAISAHGKRAVGWREWVEIPALNLPAIKAKIDSGARTSTLHAFYLEPYEIDGSKRVRFGIHPVQQRKDIVIHCAAEVVDQRIVTDSGGHRQLRYVIEVDVSLGGEVWPVEMTLTDRDTMRFRMLLGRTAMRGRLIVDPARSYLTGRMKRTDIARAYALK